jgi:hypothetical protein
VIILCNVLDVLARRYSPIEAEIGLLREERPLVRGAPVQIQAARSIVAAALVAEIGSSTLVYPRLRWENE